MCGISGVYGLENLKNPRSIVEKMNEYIAHRGPDAEGIHEGENFVLGHRRLSIIDTTAQSNQPLYSDDKSIVLVFNGELYNYLELKKELSDHEFKTNSDTEVLIAAYQKWGMAALDKFNGMFSFALWDDNLKSLFLVRDRLGIKPLYFSQTNQQVVFASEVRALLESGLVERKLDEAALVDYLRYQTVHGPRTIIKNLRLLPAGHYLKITEDDASFHEYWNLADRTNHSIGDKSLEEQLAETRGLLHSSVGLRMRADVPFGAFLSGGIDSSAVVGLMAEHTEHPVNTFNISFQEDEFSEAPFAKLIAKKFNTKHHEIELTVEKFKELIPFALDAMDHPSGDGPNTYVVSKVTKEAGITMALSGLGGDELFAGYSIFSQATSLLNKKWLASFAPVIRGIGGKIYKTLKPGIAGDKIAGILSEDYIELPYVYPWSRAVLMDQRIKKLLGQSKLPKNNMKQFLIETLYHKTSGGQLPLLSQVSLAEINTYMQHVLLRDSDQMGMAHALEIRVPFLDHRLVETAMGIPDEYKYPYSPKQFLIKSLGDLLPNEIVDRKKMGFTLPWEIWMKGDLKGFCESQLQNLGKRSYFEADQVMTLWNDFLKGKNTISWSRLWPLVVLSNWLDKNNIE